MGMDSIALNSPPPMASRTRTVNPGDGAQTPVDSKGQLPKVEPDQERATSQRAMELQRMADEAFAMDNVKLSISFNQEIGRFIYRGIDPESGEVVREYPPEEVVERIAAIREMAGIAFDRKL
jgi:flagellar protein FlaG